MSTTTAPVDRLAAELLQLAEALEGMTSHAEALGTPLHALAAMERTRHARRLLAELGYALSASKQHLEL